MAKTYNTLGTVAPGDVLRANSGTASYNGLITNVNNYRVPPMCKVLLTADRTYTAASNIAWDTNAGTYGFDTDGMWSSGAATRITANTAGVYAVTCNVEFTTAGGTIGSLFGPSITLSGTNAAFSVQYNVSGGASTYRICTSGIIAANAGQYFEANYNPSGSTGTITTKNQPYTYLSAVWIGQVS